METEKQKAAKGMLYTPDTDKELSGEMLAAHLKVQKYNNIPYDQKEERDKAICEIIDIGANGVVVSPFFCDYGYNIHIGDNFFSNTNFTVLDGARVDIGNNVYIGPNVGIYTAGHPIDAEQRAKGLEYAYPVKIEDNVWIGGHCAIVAGVTIGKGSVIGAGSIVTKDIPAGVVAVGSPCRVLRRCDEK